MAQPPTLPLARLLGPTLLLLSVTEARNASIWPHTTAAAIHLNGTALFVAGLAILQKHWVWVRGWPVAVTATGATALGLGAWRMWDPVGVLQGVRRMDGGEGRWILNYVAGFLGSGFWALSWRGV
ncbi:hypothetical protein BDY21DRAFT_361618 [Lineolata rhizophorae]|uniref:Integral membrane protein n=1 Tax=Lineolata rhizophorae TaxID=578093 RepID=A0A6A6PA08_9PEZI|nr:hypothetical protein BDY21DRAFT_361618 [Lineolata rhizophorae]